MNELRPWLALLLQRRGRLWLGGVLMAATLMAGVGLLSLSGWFITATAVTALAWGAGLAASIDIYVPGSGIRFFALARTVSRYFERLYNHDTVLRLLADLRVGMFRALSRLDGQTQSRYRASQWLNRLTRDIDTLDNLYLRLLAPPLVALLGSGLVALLIGLFLPLAGLVVIVVLAAVLMVLTLAMARWGRALSRQQVSTADALRVKAVEQAQGLAELQAWQVLPDHQHDLMARARHHSRDRCQLESRAAMGQALSELGIQGTALLILILALGAYQQELVSGPVMVMMPLAVMALAEGFNALPSAFVHWGSSEAAARRLNEQRALSGRLPEPTQPRPVTPNAPLTWKNVAVTLGAHPVFHNLNLELRPGEKLAIIGPSGAGKSTLAALAARLIDPDQGQLRWGDTALSELNSEQWRAQTAVLTQDAHLFNDSIATNLRIANPEATDEQLWQALEQVALAERVRTFSQQLDTQIGEFGRQLSGGEARRIALARILLKDPGLVILDEPLTGLDRATAEIVTSNLNRFLKTRSALLLGHEPRALPEADRVLVLNSNAVLSNAFAINDGESYW